MEEPVVKPNECTECWFDMRGLRARGGRVKSSPSLIGPSPDAILIDVATSAEVELREQQPDFLQSQLF